MHSVTSQRSSHRKVGNILLIESVIYDRWAERGYLLDRLIEDRL